MEAVNKYVVRYHDGQQSNMTWAEINAEMVDKIVDDPDVLSGKIWYKTLPVAPEADPPTVGRQILVQFEDKCYAALVRKHNGNGSFECFFPVDDETWTVHANSHK
jgi:hypothetical protein